MREIVFDGEQDGKAEIAEPPNEAKSDLVRWTIRRCLTSGGGGEYTTNIKT